MRSLLIALIGVTLSAGVFAQDFLQQWHDSATRNMSEMRAAHKPGIGAAGGGLAGARAVSPGGSPGAPPLPPAPGGKGRKTPVHSPEKREPGGFFGLARAIAIKPLRQPDVAGHLAVLEGQIAEYPGA